MNKWIVEFDDCYSCDPTLKWVFLSMHRVSIGGVSIYIHYSQWNPQPDMFHQLFLSRGHGRKKIGIAIQIFTLSLYAACQ